MPSKRREDVSRHTGATNCSQRSSPTDKACPHHAETPSQMCRRHVPPPTAGEPARGPREGGCRRRAAGCRLPLRGRADLNPHFFVRQYTAGAANTHKHTFQQHKINPTSRPPTRRPHSRLPPPPRRFHRCPRPPRHCTPQSHIAISETLRCKLSSQIAHGTWPCLITAGVAITFRGHVCVCACGWACVGGWGRAIPGQYVSGSNQDTWSQSTSQGIAIGSVTLASRVAPPGRLQASP